MKIPSVLINSKNAVLNLGMKSLFNDLTEKALVIESTADQNDDLIREINFHSPTVILLDEYSSFASVEFLSRLITKYEKLLIITVNDENNWLHVYKREEVLMTSLADLLDVITSSGIRLLKKE